MKHNSGCMAPRFPDTDIESGRRDFPRKLIITADDFGASEAINQGIRAAIETGALNSVAAMVTFPGALEELCSLHADYPKLEIGLHLSITSGHPVSPVSSVPSLTDQDGRFFTVDRCLIELSRVNMEELRRELKAQVDVVRRSSIEISCLSSQHNILALYTPFYEIVLELAREYGIALRSPRAASICLDCYCKAKTLERGRYLVRALVRQNIFKAAAFRKYGTAGEMEANWQKTRACGLPVPDYLIDSFWGTPTPENLLSILTNLPEGTSELVFHLGMNEQNHPVPKGIDANYMLMRELELCCISSPRFSRWMEILNIETVGFSELRQIYTGNPEFLHASGMVRFEESKKRKRVLIRQSKI